MKIILQLSIFLILLLIGSLSFTPHVFAAKKFAPKAKTVAPGASAGGSIPAQVGYRSDKRAILLSFNTFTGIDSVSYFFIYEASGKQEGASGSITAGNNPSTPRELLIGTCSKGVCTYHRNVTNAKLSLRAKMSNGRTVSKTYRIKTYL